jgi:hypothetical protein
MSNSLTLKSLFDFADCNDEDDPIANAVPDVFKQNPVEANRIFTDMWLYAHGIASVLVMNQLPIERSEIASMMKNMCDMLTKDILPGGKK